jgi:rubrerythrin
MSDKPILETIDPEIGERIVTRREALRGAGKWGAGLAFASVPVALAVTARSAFGNHLPQEVVNVLNFALTLEFLEAEFYNIGLAQTGLVRDREVFDQIRNHENAHVALLKAVLGQDAVAKPEFDFTAGGKFPDVFSNYTTFVTLAQGFEDAGVRAYKGQAPKLINADPILTVALQIHAVEAMHASKVRRLSTSPAEQGWIPFDNTAVPALQPVYQGEAETTQLGVNVPSRLPDFVTDKARVATESFDEPLTMQQVLQIVDQFIDGDVDGDGQPD